MAKSNVDEFSFYGGKAIVERKPWRDYYSYRRQGEKPTLLSVTRVTGKLDKSTPLMIWQKRLISESILWTLESSKTDQFSRDEVKMLVKDAIEKPEQAKVSGGNIGDAIHKFAHQFAKSKTLGTATPSVDHLDEGNEDDAKTLNGISAFMDWYNSNDVEFLETEKLFYYNSLLAGDTDESVPPIEYICIVDFVAKVNGVIAVGDYKSSKGVYSEQQYQVSANRNARDKELVALGKKDELAKVEHIVNFNKETGELITHVIDLEDSEKNFKAFLGLYQVALREKDLSKYA